MKTFLFRLNFLILILAISPIISFGCSLIHTPISKFPKQYYVFIGEVIEYTDKISSKEFLNAANGLKIKVVESVNLPKQSNDYFEVFPFGSAPDCTDIGFNRDQLERYYPINSKVRVTALAAEMLPGKNQTGQIRLEAPGLLRIYRNDWEDRINTNVLSKFNYQKSKQNESGLLYFELLKDLNRLEKLTLEEEKVEVFERLVFFPENWFDFEKAVQNYIKTPQTQTKLIEKRSDNKKRRF